MLTDLLLAIAHHLLIFALAAILTAELILVRPQMTSADVLRVGRIDVAYGVTAGLILIIGFARVFFGLRGPEFYFANGWFHAKLTALIVVGLLSIVPTLRLLKWRRAVQAQPGFVPPADEIKKMRRFIHMEAGVFILIPIFAAMMVRL